MDGPPPSSPFLNSPLLKMSRGPNAKNWLATVYDMGYAATLETWGPQGSNPICNYLVFSHEVCPTTDQPHLQCYFVFKQPMCLSGLKKLHSSCKWIAANGTVEENCAYYFKEANLPHGKVVEVGDWRLVCGIIHSGGLKQGRADLDAFKLSVCNGCSI
jgi:hypothetical protein